MASFLKQTFELLNTVIPRATPAPAPPPRQQTASSNHQNVQNADYPRQRINNNNDNNNLYRQQASNPNWSRNNGQSTQQQQQSQNQNADIRYFHNQQQNQNPPASTNNSTHHTNNLDYSHQCHGQPLSPPQASSNTNTNQQQTGYNMTSQSEEIFTIKDLKDICDIDKLTAKQLKTILVRNCVDYRGAIEKEELRAKLRMLWVDYHGRREARKAKRLDQDRNDSLEDDIDDKKMCKICMEREIDSVLLECGHMLSCVECGRKLSDCPICRQRVTRCVRTFQV